MKSHPVKEWSLGIALGNPGLCSSKDISNIGHVNVPPAVSHPTDHDICWPWYRLLGVAVQEHQSVSQRHQCQCTHHDIACCDIGNVESNQCISLFLSCKCAGLVMII